MADSQRLQLLELLFANDKHLLRMDTGLYKPVPIQEHPEPVKETQKTQKAQEAQKVPAPLPKMEAPSKWEIPSTVPSVNADGTFCPIVTLSRFPYKYITKSNDLSQKVACHFFDQGKFWTRKWDLYYIHLPAKQSARTLLLTPVVQARQFFSEINRALECNLTLPSDPNAGLILDFKAHAAFPGPTFLGQSTSRETKAHLDASIPLPPFASTREGSLADEEYLAYEVMLETASATAKNKKKGVSRAKMLKRLQEERDLALRLRRTQCYLGLRAEKDLEIDSAHSELNPSEVSWEEEKQRHGVGLNNTHDPSKPAPYPFWKDPVFISIDVEMNELVHSQVTEVGISILDTLDLKDVAPGQHGEDWRSKIHSSHFRVREYANVVNRRYLRGCPENFEFGESQWIGKEELGRTIEGLFDNFDDDGVQSTLVLVGHNIPMDIQYLKEAGVPSFQNEVKFKQRIADTLDTAEFFRVIRGESSVRSLGALLEEFGLMGWHLHNAGNDARYAMEVLLGMMLEKKSMDTKTDATANTTVDT